MIQPLAAMPVVGRPAAALTLAEVQAAAEALGLRMHVGKASTEDQIDAAFAAFVQARVDAVFTAGDPFNTPRSSRQGASPRYQRSLAWG